MSSPLQNNITSLQNLLDKVNALPESGVNLPELTNEGVADDLVSGKELIDSSGNVITGTNPYEKSVTDTEVATQTELLAQAVAALEGKVGSGNGNTGSVMQIASGTYNLRTEHSSAKQITISGLEFAPKSLIIYFGSEAGKTYYFPEVKYVLCSLQVGELFDYTATCISPQSGASIAMSGIHNCDDKYSIQLTHDGFILSYPNDDYAVSVGTYFYHAFG